MRKATGRLRKAKELCRTASILYGMLLLAAALLWESEHEAMGQSADPLSPAPDRVEGASDVLLLGTSATGTVAELLVAGGEHVKAGRHLVRIECSAVDRELEARKSDLAAAEAVLSRVVNGPRPEEIAIGVSNVNLAIARSEEADKTVDRAHRLRAGYTVTQAQIDQAERDSRIAAAQLDEVRAKLDLLRAARGRKISLKPAPDAMPPRSGWEKPPPGSAIARWTHRSTAWC
jgi:multidrug efflux pump subunit AcrA (membrane-fusion protein)